ncbi:fimbrial protein [Escherichia albertii]|uniref:fimbrial protein n=1 Tax=Escherichia albertii TaxID=208962 RepID=UPI0011F0F822|nr:fimbrial protein [Escherichia albertii]MCB2261176.1 FasG [Escherichia albertii]MCB2268937.1 FasG [Escherichia albertii]MCB2273524.1 FasG [Escherichia albertii]
MRLVFSRQFCLAKPFINKSGNSLSLSVITGAVFYFFALSCMAATSASNDATFDASKTLDFADGSIGWFKLTELNIQKAASANASYDECSGMKPCAYSQVTVPGSIVMWPGSYWQGYIKAKPYTYTTNDGTPLVFSVWFANGQPTLKWEERNKVTNSVGHHSARAPVGSYAQLAGGTTDWKSSDSDGNAFLRPSLKCGSMSGCVMKGMTYFDSAHDAKVNLSLQLPKGFTKKTYSFSFVPVMEIGHTLRNEKGTASSTMSATLYISGSITIPDRCYINNTSNSEIKFNDVSAGAADGLIESRDVTLSTTCRSLNTTVKQYIKVTRTGAGGNNSAYQTFAEDTDGNKALALAMRIIPQGENGSVSCNPVTTEKVQFGPEYLIRTLQLTGLDPTYRDTIKFGLCKYGIPATYGEKSIPITITSRWVN